MANLQAIGFDGETVIYLLAEGAGTNLDPFVSKFKLVDQDLLATDAGLTAIADLIPEFVFDGSGRLSVATNLSQPLTLAQLNEITVKVLEQSPLNLTALATKAKQDDLLAKIPNNLTVEGDKLKIKTELNQPLTLAELNATTVKTQEQSPLNLSALATKAKQDDLLAKIPNQINNRIPVDIGGDGSITITSGTITVANTVEITNDEGDPIPVVGTVTLSSESGFLPYRNTALSSPAQTVKNSAGSLMGWNAINVNTVPVYLKFYNSASPTVGTTTPLLTIMIPPGDGVSPGFFFQEPSLVPIEVFSTAISVACVTGLADNSTTAPSTAIHFSARYK